MSFDQSAGDGQPEAGASTLQPTTLERAEYALAVVRRHARPLVDHLGLHEVAVERGPDRDGCRGLGVDGGAAALAGSSALGEKRTWMEAV